MDREKISLEWEKLYDPKTKLNEDIIPLKNYLELQYVVKDNYSVNQYQKDVDATSTTPANRAERYEVKIVITEKSTGRILLVTEPVLSSTVKSAEHISAEKIREMPLFQEIKQKYQKIKQENQMKKYNK